MRDLIKVGLAILISALPVSARAQGVGVDVPLSNGGVERVLFVASANPRALLIMFPGGDGILDIGDTAATSLLAGNFLVRTLPLWQAQGFAVEVLGSPQNQSLVGQRHTAAYAAAVDRAVDFGRTRVNAPVWLIGTSAGTTGAANAAAALGGKVAGLVLTSSITRQTGETVFDTNLGAISVPALVVANQGDTCSITPPEDAPVLASHLARSPRKEVMLVESSTFNSKPCEALSPHGFYGIEPMVVQRIADWIKR